MDSALHHEISVTTQQSSGFLGQLVNSVTSGEGMVLSFPVKVKWLYAPVIVKTLFHGYSKECQVIVDRIGCGLTVHYIQPVFGWSETSFGFTQQTYSGAQFELRFLLYRGSATDMFTRCNWAFKR